MNEAARRILVAVSSCILLLFCSLPLHARGTSQRLQVASPGGSVVFTLGANPFSYNVAFHGVPVVLSSPLGLEFREAGRLSTLRITDYNKRSLSETWKPVWGKTAKIQNRFRELTVDLQEASPSSRRLEVIIRCYDDGVAFRYVVPAQERLSDFVLTRELTGFHLAESTNVWASSYKSFRSPYESEYVKRSASDIAPSELLGLPLLFHAGSMWGALMEAELTNWAGMYLRRSGEGLQATLSPRRDGAGLVVAQAPHPSPWRVIMLARTSAALIESNLIENLSSRSKIENTSWIKPGLMAWDHWWSGDVEMTNAENERFIDFASYMGFPYQLVDWQWYGLFNKPDADITRPAAQLDMTALLRYASRKNVRLWLWIHSGDVDRAVASSNLDTAFATYERWGIAGVKVDFMQSDDQARVRWYEQVVKLAAAHHLMVDFHGAYKPTGLDVTYPNLLTREAVLGNEYNKFSRRDTPLHKATLPFTRGLAGPMDYTPGAFLNRSPAEFKPQKPTEAMGTRAGELALFVVYWSPLTCVADDPSHYIASGKEEQGLAFLRDLPTVWDETRALDGAVGDHIVVARRRGRDWWLGGITGARAYTTSLPLNFLGRGHFMVHIFQDAATPQAPYTAIQQEDREVTAKDVLSLSFREGGGGTAMYFHRISR